MVGMEERYSKLYYLAFKAVTTIGISYNHDEVYESWPILELRTAKVSVGDIRRFSFRNVLKTYQSYCLIYF